MRILNDFYRFFDAHSCRRWKAVSAIAVGAFYLGHYIALAVVLLFFNEQHDSSPGAPFLRYIGLTTFAVTIMPLSALMGFGREERYVGKGAASADIFRGIVRFIGLLCALALPLLYGYWVIAALSAVSATWIAWTAGGFVFLLIAVALAWILSPFVPLVWIGGTIIDALGTVLSFLTFAFLFWLFHRITGFPGT